MKDRSRSLNNKPVSSGPIVYWMQREHRVQDNWALLHALQLAERNNSHVEVIFVLRKEFKDATKRLIDFMLSGLEEVETELRQLNIPFTFILDSPESGVSDYCEKISAGALITEFHSLKTERVWRENLAKKLPVAFHEVDTRNIIPCWIASDKQEYSAYTLRSKYNKKLPDYLDEIPKVSAQKNVSNHSETKWEEMLSSISMNQEVTPASFFKPGTKEAFKHLDKFIHDRINDYAEKRNDPNFDVQSKLSPYLHFGHISAQRVVIELQKSFRPEKITDFIEEITVRRELADNFCFYNPNYDSTKGFPDWAKKTIAEHKNDPREHNYSLTTLIESKTHDDLWNAAQLQAVKTGYMHGYMRMYWAKKILEWSESVDAAQAKAIHIMDTYFLDGRESNGFTGIAWSMGGVHDRAWQERPIFGKLRYMSYDGAKRKFDIKSYIKKMNEL